MAENEPLKHDPERVLSLRRAALERAGYDADRADELARRLDIDLQQAVSLPRAGFPRRVRLPDAHVRRAAGVLTS